MGTKKQTDTALIEGFDGPPGEARARVGSVPRTNVGWCLMTLLLNHAAVAFNQPGIGRSQSGYAWEQR